MVRTAASIERGGGGGGREEEAEEEEIEEVEASLRKRRCLVLGDSFLGIRVSSLRLSGACGWVGGWVGWEEEEEEEEEELTRRKVLSSLSRKSWTLVRLSSV